MARQQGVMKHIFTSLLSAIVSLWLSTAVLAQTSPDTLRQATLNDCIQYAINHQPLLKQSVIDQSITDRTIRSALADWLPQVGFNYNIQHYLKLPVQLFPNFSNPTSGERLPVTVGVANTSTLQLVANQTIFNRDVLLANRTADTYRQQSRQAYTRTKIEVISGVSKAFYDVLLSQRQAEIINQDIVRLERSLKDAVNQYESGIVDKTDAKRASISLNNTRAQRKQYLEQASAKYQTLKQLMGYPAAAKLVLAYDTLQLANEVIVDTNRAVNPRTRIEYQALQTQRQLQEANVLYTRWSYLPTVGAFGYYNLLYQNAQFGQLYSRSFPNSYIGLSLALPIFQGGKRIQQQQIARLQVQRIDQDFIALAGSIDAEYAQALASYKGNLANYIALRENVELAEDVYRIINLQYRSGIRTYLDVTVAEADLRSARISFYNALFQALISKVDVQRALGDIQ